MRARKAEKWLTYTNTAFRARGSMLSYLAGLPKTFINLQLSPNSVPSLQTCTPLRFTLHSSHLQMKAIGHHCSV